MEYNRGTPNSRGFTNLHPRDRNNTSKPPAFFRYEQSHQHGMHPHPGMLRNVQSTRPPFPNNMQAPGPSMVPHQHQPFRPQFPSAIRGIRRPRSNSQQQIHQFPLIGAPRGDNDTSGRDTQLSFTGPNPNPTFNLFSTPPPSCNIPILLTQNVPMNEQPGWVQTGLIMERPLSSSSLHNDIPPPIFQSPMNLPYVSPGFEVPPPPPHTPAYSLPLPGHWQQFGTSYYDPRQGYYTGNIPFNYQLQSPLHSNNSTENNCNPYGHAPIIELDHQFVTGTQFYQPHKIEIFDGSVHETVKELIQATDKTDDDIGTPLLETPTPMLYDVKAPENFDDVTSNNPVDMETIDNETMSSFQPFDDFTVEPETKSNAIEITGNMLDSPNIVNNTPPIADFNIMEEYLKTEDTFEIMKLKFLVSPQLQSNETECLHSRPILKTCSKFFDYNSSERVDGRIYGQHCGHGGVKGPADVHNQPPEAPAQQHMSPASRFNTTINFKELNRQAEEFRQKQLDLMVPLVKDVYSEAPEVGKLTDEQVKMIRESKSSISVQYIRVDELCELRNPDTKVDTTMQIPIPNPVVTFEQCFRLHPEIILDIAKQGFSEPSPIQCQMWPCIMKGMDVVGIAQTGSGKTLAFLLPALLHIEKQLTPREQRKGPTVLILAPTRELAQQIDNEVKKYSYKDIRSVCVYGGVNRQEQIDSVLLQTEIVIATPGRLNDLVQSGSLSLKEVSMLILDEADEMLNQGFEPQINKALLNVRGDRQTIMTSATWPVSVRRMVCNYTKNPVMVVVGTTDVRAVNTVKQNIIFLETEEERFRWVVDFIKEMNPNDKAIIFVGRRGTVDSITNELYRKNISVQSIHGGHTQQARQQALADMKNGNARILVATDVAARGIDIDNVTHIINHEFPTSVEQYVHRIGRTGRAGKTGESHTFIGRQDWGSAKQLVEILKHAKQIVPEELVNMADRFENRRVQDDAGARRGRGWEDRGGRRGGWVDRGGYNRGRYNSNREGGQLFRGRFNAHHESHGTWDNTDNFVPGSRRGQRY